MWKKHLIFLTMLIALDASVCSAQSVVELGEYTDLNLVLSSPSQANSRKQVSPDSAFRILQRAKVSSFIQLRDSGSPDIRGWHLLQFASEQKPDYAELSIVMPKGGVLEVFESMDSGRTFHRADQRVNAAFQFGASIGPRAFSQKKGSADTSISASFNPLVGFPKNQLENWFVSLLRIAKHGSGLLLIKLNTPHQSAVAVQVRSFTRRVPRTSAFSFPPDYLLVLMLLFSMFCFLKTKDLAFIAVAGLVLLQFFQMMPPANVDGPLPIRPWYLGLHSLSHCFATLLLLDMYKAPKPLLVLWLLLAVGDVVFWFNVPFSFRVPRFVSDLLFSLLPIFVISCVAVYLATKTRKLRFYYYFSLLLVLPYLLPFLVFSHWINAKDLQVILGAGGGSFMYLAACFLVSVFRYRISEYRKKEDSINQKLARQKETAEEVIKALENERQRLAQDLHDQLGNHLAIFKMRLYRSGMDEEGKKELIGLVDKVANDAKAISYNLMPPEFDRTDFYDLMRSYFLHLDNLSSMRFHFQSAGSTDRFSKSHELMIYRMIMEITNNILRHSSATEATIQLIYNRSGLQIMAEDNGKGIAKAKVSPGIGTKSLKSRIQYLSGKMVIDSNERGTTIIIDVPYPEDIYAKS